MVKKKGKMHSFKIKADAKKVFLKGSWNDWKAEEMKKNKKGLFAKRKKLAPGRYEFGYLIDGEWVVDEFCETVDSPFGSKNSILEVKE